MHLRLRLTAVERCGGAATVFMLEQQGHAREGTTARLAAVLLNVRMRLQVGAQV